MSYTPSIFAKAFFDVLQEIPKNKHAEIIKNFAYAIKKYGAQKKSSEILLELKKLIAKKEGVPIVRIETARELKSSLINNLKSQFPKNSDFLSIINTDLIAGIKLTINEEITIDNSLQRKLRCMK